MPQFLVAIHHPDDFKPGSESEATGQDIHDLNKEMIAAGVRVFAGGLDLSSPKSVQAQANGEVKVTDGPYLKTKEQVGGFWILECADMDAALGWARKATVACKTPVEVRQFFFKPAS